MTIDSWLECLQRTPLPWWEILHRVACSSALCLFLSVLLPDPVLRHSYFAFHSFILCILFTTVPVLQGFGSDFFFSAVRLFFKIYFLYTCVSECMYVYRLHADTSGGQKRARHTHFQTGMDWGDMGIEESISMEANCLEQQKAVVSLREPRLHQGRWHFNIS